MTTHTWKRRIICNMDTLNGGPYVWIHGFRLRSYMDIPCQKKELYIEMSHDEPQKWDFSWFFPPCVHHIDHTFFPAFSSKFVAPPRLHNLDGPVASWQQSPKFNVVKSDSWKHGKSITTYTFFYRFLICQLSINQYSGWIVIHKTDIFGDLGILTRLTHIPSFRYGQWCGWCRSQVLTFWSMALSPETAQPDAKKKSIRSWFISR